MTDVCLILDESGSMSSKYNETIVGFNEYIKGVREDLSVDRVFAITFNSMATTRVYDGVHVSEVGDLGKGNYNPRGTTPLYDAIGRTLETMVGNQMFVVVITDGQENASTEYNRDSIKAMIESREAQGWDFIFLGADFDAWGQARGLGITRGKTLSFSGAQMREGMDAARQATTAYNTTGEALPDDYFEGYFDPDNNQRSND